MLATDFFGVSCQKPDYYIDVIDYVAATVEDASEKLDLAMDGYEHDVQVSHKLCRLEFYLEAEHLKLNLAVSPCGYRLRCRAYSGRGRLTVWFKSSITNCRNL